MKIQENFNLDNETQEEFSDLLNTATQYSYFYPRQKPDCDE